MVTASFLLTCSKQKVAHDLALLSTLTPQAELLCLLLYQVL